MYSITLQVIATGKTFTKTYVGYFWYEKELNKYFRSKNLRVLESGERDEKL